MKKHFLIIILLALSVGFISVNAEATFTVATFADPSGDSDNPLFRVDFRPAQMKLTGGWADTETGLILEIPCSGYTVENGNAFHDAWFEMTEVGIINTFGDTGGGEINFYRNGFTTNPLLTITFESGYVDYHNFGADEFFGENVTISVIGITGTLSEERFSFSFINQAYLTGSTDWNDGFTATASFTSSAVPEPATICLLGFGVFSLVRRKKSAKRSEEEMWSTLCAPHLKKTIRGEDV